MNKEEADLIDELILALLAVNNNEPIRGRIRFTKELFIYSIKFDKELFEVFEFYPYYFGPYSTRMAARVNFLKDYNYITAEYSNYDWKYFLSDKGLNEASKFLKEIPSEKLRHLGEIKKRNRKLSLKNLLKELYTEYPKYTTRSIIKKDILRVKIKPEDLEPIDDGPGFVASMPLEEQEITLKDKAARKFLELISD